MVTREKVIFIVGPTASGKSQLAMDIAIRFDGEIICADSQTIRKNLDIGTAKPSERDRMLVQHHMLDIVEPYERFSAADFKTRAQGIIEDIKSRGKLPIVVGGTGLYIDSLIYDFSFRSIPDQAQRRLLETMTVAELRNIIKDRGLELPRNELNPRHLIRTIETNGVKPVRSLPRKDAVVVGIDPQNMLQERIARRVDYMLSHGFIEEVQRVIEQYGDPPTGWDALGYGIVRSALYSEQDKEGIAYSRETCDCSQTVCKEAKSLV